MVIDADGRKISFIKLVNAPRGDPTPGRVAEWLRESLKKKPRERFHFRIHAALGDTEKDFLGALGKIEGVHSVEMKKDTVLVTADPGILTPENVLAPIEKDGLSLSLVEPIPVRFERREKTGEESARLDLGGVPGLWSTGKGDRPCALVAKFLIHPPALESAAHSWKTDVESRDFSLPDVSTGHSGMKVIFPIANRKGVLALFPDLLSEGATAVGRKGEVDWEAVLKTFRDGGVPGAKVLSEQGR